MNAGDFPIKTDAIDGHHHSPHRTSMPSAKIIPERSGASKKDHKPRNTQSRVVTVTKTIWNPLRDMGMAVGV